MADDLLGGILGEEEEKPEVEAPEALAGAEAFASAVAARLSGNDPEVARKTAAFLDKQTQLLETQNEHLKDEHALRLTRLRNQLSEEGTRRLGLRLRVAFQIFVALVATVIGLGFALMIRDAFNAHGAVIEAFSVPPELAQRGLTGQVIARQVLDQLSKMEAVASVGSARPASSYTTSWGNDLKVEVPETGVSFGELRRMLYEALGHETRISGEVYATATGYTVTARDAERAGKAFAGRADELSTLIRKAAESIYEQTQPYRFAVHLYYTDRPVEALPILARLTRDPNPVERAWAHLLIGANKDLQDGDLAGSAEEYRASVAALPDFVRAYEFRAVAETLRGHEVAAVEAADQCLALKPEGNPGLNPAWRNSVAATCLAVKGSAEGNFSEIARATADSDPAKFALMSAGGALIGPLLTHDLDAAAAYDWEPALAVAASAPDRRRRIAEIQDSITARIALERGDPRAVQLWAAVSASDEEPASPTAHDFMLRLSGKWLALAKARFGDLPGAQALIAETPMDCRMCVDFRGRIAAFAGNAAQAEKWFTQAINMAPKLPQVYIDRGQTRLDRGDIAGALADATQSTTLSPRDSDAWKLWGDVLMKQGNSKDALSKYDEGLKYAPNWKELKEARAAAKARV
jgi:tetratricopeptide (TPR) repeat protein